MIDENTDLILRNKKLVKLPFKGTPRYELSSNRVEKELWIEKCEQYEVQGFRQHAPLSWNPAAKQRTQKPHSGGFALDD
jgi:hypothetical protein